MPVQKHNTRMRHGIARDAFHYCLNLEEVVAPATIDHIDMFDGEKEWNLKH